MKLSKSISQIEYLVTQLYWVLTTSDKDHEFNLMHQIGSFEFLVENRPTPKEIMGKLYPLLASAYKEAKSQERL